VLKARFEESRLRDAVVVSPKLLSSAEKVERWEKLWFPVTLHESA
jgi:hypothetical protein